MIRLTKVIMLLTDLFFILYWAATAFAWFPPEILFQDYHDPMVTAWNWSFLPLDLLISASGLASLLLAGQTKEMRRRLGERLMAVSLTLTVCSGLMAIAFWTIRGDFDAAWWLANGFLLLFPLPALASLVAGATPKEEHT